MSSAREQDGSLHVDPVELVELYLPHTLNGVRPERARVVHEHIEAPESRDGGVDCSVYLRGVRRLERDALHALSGPDLPRRGPGGFDRPTRQHDPRPRAHETRGDGSPDPTASPSNDRDLAV